ncbi:methyltransferase domain-containing protein [Lichenihabitans sp. Uapishka_5]|uniref:class I SAM-dependent methyltransferase n=1 Tax=Lichenihabitans sp. Uapishka_5 TaxID=3037302 RepID=UPI0029E801D3|nr:methyltransferase domain-containing protein [Lichenihabitans sp. Uapishka_5]MDX7949736.1 methyltransferase domain-containing protein [Lichenihabitans sp. Uapishka_5]
MRSPVTGAFLEPDGPALLRDQDGRFWPVVDGIPYLRVGREALVDAAVACLRDNDRDGALIILLADQDDWWTGAKPEERALRHLLAERDRLSLRDAMDLLGFDRVGHYFAHRWSDPTFLAGLALLEAHWRPAGAAFELACGIGHYGRELLRRGVAFTGGDVVFSKLWLARHWVLPPAATLVCFDAAAPWPVADGRFDLVFCHDAFYFLEPKPAILAALRRLRSPTGRLALSHIHNSGADNLSAGRAVSVDDMGRFFPDATIYDDAELTQALVEARPPRSQALPDLSRVEAFSLEDGVMAADPVASGWDAPLPAAALRLNPLYQGEGEALAVAWPSPRYEAEYAGRSTFPLHLSRAEGDRLLQARDATAVRTRTLVDLPERW